MSAQKLHEQRSGGPNPAALAAEYVLFTGEIGGLRAEPSALEDIHRAALSGMMALPRELEVGGLLLGGGGEVFQITAAEQVEMEHRFGRLFG